LIDADGKQVGILPIQEALQLAKDAGLDLVEISPNAEPPVCRIMDYSKHVFEARKQKKDAKKRQKVTKIKEVKFRPVTEIGDYQVKLRNLIRFLENGDKVKITLRFRGREMMHQELGMKLLVQIQTDAATFGTVEQFPRLEGRQMVMVIAPKKK
jgi:translation initiation factor IF-3